MFFIPSDNWKTFFFIQTYRYPKVWCNRHVAAFFEISVLKEVFILYPLSPQKHYNAANTTKVQKLLLLKEEICNTMNLYCKYTSIPKSSFYKINILPINTGKKYLKYSIHFPSICDYQPL